MNCKSFALASRVRVALALAAVQSGLSPCSVAWSAKGRAGSSVAATSPLSIIRRGLVLPFLWPLFKF